MNIVYLKTLFEFNKLTGNLHWKVSRSNRVKVGSEAGYINTHDGYRYINIDRKMYKAHRLVWLYVFGEFPDGILDHKNQCRSDNRIHNLRECSQSENMCNRGKTANNTSGYKGVCFHKTTGKWRASVIKHGKKHSLGLHFTPEDAYIAYVKGCELIHKEFANVT